MDNEILKSEIENILTCNECGTKFEEKVCFKAHIKSKHIANPDRCDKCNAMFEKNYELKRHYIDHHVSKDWKCIECEKRFCSGNKLNQHKKKIDDVRASKDKLFIYEKELIWTESTPL